MSPQRKHTVQRTRSRGRPADQSPIYVTSQRPKRSDSELLASALLAHYRNISGTASDPRDYLLGNGTVSDRADNDGEASS